MGVHETEFSAKLNVIGEMAFAEMQRVVQRSGLTILITLLASILVGTLYGWFSTKSIVRQVRHVSDGLKKLAMGAGDLATRLPVESKDEIGDLSRWFNQFMEKQQEMIKEIADAASGIESSSSNIFGISRTVSKLSVNMSEKSNNVAAAAEQMSGTMTTIATAVEEQSASTSEIARTISKVFQGVAGVNERVDASSKSSESIAADIASVDQDARKMENESSRANTDAETLSRLARQLKEMVSRFVI